MSLISRILKANPSAQVSSVLTGSFTIPSAKGAFYEPPTPRGLFVGGQPVSNPAVNIDYIEIATTGNAANFGDLTFGAYDCPGVNASTTRAVIGGGQRRVSNVNAYSNIMDYVTIATTGNATDFGDLTVARQCTSAGSVTRGLYLAGYDGTDRRNVIDYITIATTGNATDFGDTSFSRDGARSCASPTKALVGGGVNDGNTASATIDKVTIATTGNGTNFGNLASARFIHNSFSSNTRGLFAMGTNGGDFKQDIGYVTIATDGNSTNFGNASIATNGSAGTSSSVRGVFGGGDNAGGKANFIDYVTMATTGNATDFGDLTAAKNSLGAGSNSHGGISA